MDDISFEFRASCLSLDTDPFCLESAADEYLLLQTVPSKVFAEQLTYKDAVGSIDFSLSVLFLCWSVLYCTKFYMVCSGSKDA